MNNITTLCFGTFFTLLCGNRKDWDKATHPEVSNRILYFTLLDIVDDKFEKQVHLKRAENKTNPNYKDDVVSVAKNCSKNGDHPIQREGCKKIYVGRFENDYPAVLKDFSEYITKCFDVNQCERLGRSIIELIVNSDNIDEGACFFIDFRNRRGYTKQKIANEAFDFYLPALIAGVLYHIIKENIPNGSEEAKATIAHWKETYIVPPKCPEGKTLASDYVINQGIDIKNTQIDNFVISHKEIKGGDFVGFIDNPELSARAWFKSLKKKAYENKKKIILLALFAFFAIIIGVAHLIISSKSITSPNNEPQPLDSTGEILTSADISGQSTSETVEPEIPYDSDFDPNNPPIDGFEESDFVPLLSDELQKRYPLLVRESDVDISDFESAVEILEKALSLPNNEIPNIASQEKSYDSYYSEESQTNDEHSELWEKFNNDEINVIEMIDEMEAIIAQQERAFEYSKNELGGVYDNLMILIARNYRELGMLHESLGDQQIAFTYYIKSIEMYVLCTNVLRKVKWTERDIQAEYSIDYWVASTFYRIASMKSVNKLFRANGFVSSRGFFGFFEETFEGTANAPTTDHSKRLYVYSIYFAGHTAYSTALAIRDENPAVAISYAEAAKNYYALYLELPLDYRRHGNSEFKSYCSSAIEQLDELIKTLKEN